MGTIKFRAWDKKFKRMEYDLDWDGEDSVNTQIEAYQNALWEIMQFTGLTDKNGKEIYEGDIVEVKYSDGSGYDNPVEVSFENGSFWAGMGYLNDVKIIEVIGNIYEDAHLLDN